jgi:integrase
MATIRRRGDKWQVQIRRKGEAPQTKSFHRKKDAEVWARQIELQADRHELPKDPRALEQWTLGELVERYRDEVSIHKRGYEIEKIVLNAFLRHRICSKPLSEISPSDFAAYRDERLKEILPTSLKRQLSPLHNMFEIARDEWGLPLHQNPLDAVQINRDHRRRERRLREGELERLVEAARSCRNPHITPIILLAVATGMRRGEILAIEWGHLRREDRSLLIPHTKNGYPRNIPLSRIALGVLEGVGRSEERVFAITVNAFRLSWQRLRYRAQIDDLHFHDLRHEAISRFFEMGLTTPEVALISGHRDMRMLFRYTHPMRRRVLDKLDRCALDTQ